MRAVPKKPVRPRPKVRVNVGDLEGERIDVDAGKVKHLLLVKVSEDADFESVALIKKQFAEALGTGFLVVVMPKDCDLEVVSLEPDAKGSAGTGKISRPGGRWNI